jgi:hypothetical protein
MDGDGSANPVDDGTIEARMEDGDGDPEIAALESMGYIDDEAEVSRETGESTSSATSVLETVVILAIVVLFALAVVYILLV